MKCYTCIHYDVCKLVDAVKTLGFLKSNLAEECRKRCIFFIEQEKGEKSLKYK